MHVYFAHDKKRRFLTKEELFIVARLCNHCHSKIEGKPEMQEVILSIRKRNPIPEINRVINEYRSDGKRSGKREV
jgi:hypothetical protein